MSELAICGGRPSVPHPKPHANRAVFTPADRAAIETYFEDPAPQNSYFGREGMLGAFERELAGFFGRGHCVLTNSGTSALHTAFFAAGVEPGDEVIGPAYTFHATVTPVFRLGAVPVLCDAEADTGNIDPDRIESLITEKTRAIVVTHQWGHPVDALRIAEIARRRGLVLIEDLSLAFGATLDGRLTGTFGDIACFSLGSTKLLSGGQGGGLVLDDQTMWERSNLIGHFARRSFDAVQSPALRQFADTGYGHNFRMHTLAIAISRSRFHRRAELMSARHARYERLSAHLSATGVIDPPVTRPGVYRGGWQGYCARHDPERTGVPLDVLVRALAAEGLEVSAGGYHLPLHYSRIFQSRSDGQAMHTPPPSNRRVYRRGDFPVAERHVGQLIGFPLFLDEELELVDAYGEACQKVCEQLERLRHAVV